MHHVVRDGVLRLDVQDEAESGELKQSRKQQRGKLILPRRDFFSKPRFRRELHSRFPRKPHSQHSTILKNSKSYERPVKSTAIDFSTRKTCAATKDSDTVGGGGGACGAATMPKKAMYDG